MVVESSGCVGFRCRWVYYMVVEFRLCRCLLSVGILHGCPVSVVSVSVVAGYTTWLSSFGCVGVCCRWVYYIVVEFRLCRCLLSLGILHGCRVSVVSVSVVAGYTTWLSSFGCVGVCCRWVFAVGCPALAAANTLQAFLARKLFGSPTKKMRQYRE
jgi:Fe2+ transport system protein FeoA